MRELLLSLSENERFRKWAETFPPSQHMARRFVAGESLPDALHEIESLNSNGILATLDHLGENTHNPQEARQAAETYLDILNEIERAKVQSNASLKLTQMGLDLGNDLCYENVQKIVARAQELKNFVRIDMEGSDYTDRTLRIYRRLRADGFDNVGVVIQAYLYRSVKDIDALIEHGLNVRVCKGAYSEPEDLAFPEKRDVDQNYLNLLSQLWQQTNQPMPYVAVATHDEALIQQIKQMLEQFDINKSHFEFQMLYGIRRDLQRLLAHEGYRVRVYVSYGREWYPYFMRRLAERPANLLFLLRNLLRK